MENISLIPIGNSPLGQSHNSTTIVKSPILIVEDQNTLATLLAKTIEERWQAEVHIASTYAEAKELLKQHRQEYLVAVCDLNLPDAPHAEILELIHRANVKAIALTGAYGNDVREKLSNKMVVDYVLKQSINSFNYVVDLIGRLYLNRDIKVLVVDDSLVSQEILTSMLQVQNFNVLTAQDGEQALKLMKEHQDIKLMITDYNMPNKNGIELTVETRKLRARNELSIIGLSASDNTDLGAMFIKNGASDFLVKPFSFEELLCRVNQNMEVLEYIELINEIANKDFLTKLNNRRSFFAEAQTILEESIAKNQPLSVVMIDIDRFKLVNDNYGHDGGDIVLVEFASMLSNHFKDCLIGRLGGEEFALMMPNKSIDKCIEQLDMFRNHFAQITFSWEDSRFSCTASFGVVDKLNECLDLMLKKADEKLYEAKKAGRNRIVR